MVWENDPFVHKSALGSLFWLFADNFLLSIAVRAGWQQSTWDIWLLHNLVPASWLLKSSCWTCLFERKKKHYKADKYTQNSYQNWHIRYAFKLLCGAVIIIILTVGIILFTLLPRKIAPWDCCDDSDLNLFMSIADTDTKMILKYFSIRYNIRLISNMRLN